MATLPRQFVWLAKKDEASTHLVLEPGKTYATSAVSGGLLINWMREGKLKFVADAPGTEGSLPADTVLEVQKGTIDVKDLLDHIKAGLKKEKSNG